MVVTADFLFQTHSMIAVASGIVALELQRPEAEMLASSINEVASFYDVPSIAPETLAWIGLGQALFTIYGTRLIAARLKRAMNNARPVQPKPASPQAPPAPQYTSPPTPQPGPSTTPQTQGAAPVVPPATQAIFAEPIEVATIPGGRPPEPRRH